MLKPWTRYLLYIGTLPTDLVGWLVVLFVRLAWGRELHWQDGVLSTILRADSAPARSWYAKWGGTAIGHAIFVKEGMPPSVYAHELVHVEQCEAAGIVGVVIALATLWWAWWIALAFWCLTPTLAYVLAGVTALARGEDWYRGNHNEEAARRE